MIAFMRTTPRCGQLGVETHVARFDDLPACSSLKSSQHQSDQCGKQCRSTICPLNSDYLLCEFVGAPFLK
jgi:hypothetical protein